MSDQPTIPTHDHDLDHKCPWCADENTGAIGGEKKPEIGDALVCINCAGISVWAPDGIRAANLEERMQLIRNPGIVECVQAIADLAIRKGLWIDPAPAWLIPTLWPNQIVLYTYAMPSGRLLSTNQTPKSDGVLLTDPIDPAKLLDDEYLINSTAYDGDTGKRMISIWIPT